MDVSRILAYSRARGANILYRYVPENCFKFTKGSFEELSCYTFNKKVVDHMFCPVCGSSICSKKGTTVIVNCRCVEGVDPRALELVLGNQASA